MDIKNTERFKNKTIGKASIRDAIKKATAIMQKSKEQVEKKNS